MQKKAEYNNCLSLTRDRPKPNHRHRRNSRVAPTPQAISGNQEIRQQRHVS